MRGYMLIANTSQSTINYPALVSVLLLLLVGVLCVRYIRSGGRDEK